MSQIGDPRLKEDDLLLSKILLQETRTRGDKKPADTGELMQEILKAHIKKEKKQKHDSRAETTKKLTSARFIADSEKDEICISKSTISKIQSNILELHQNNRCQQEEIERLGQLLEESRERERNTRESALSQKNRMEKIISTLQSSIAKLEQSMAKNAIETTKSARETMGTLELDLVKQKLITKSLHEQLYSLNRRQEQEREKIKGILRNQAVVFAEYQDLSEQNKKLKNCFEIIANSA